MLIKWLTQHVSEMAMFLIRFVKVLQLLLGAIAKLQKATISFVVCGRPYPTSAWNILAPTRRISVKFGIWVVFESLPRKSNSHRTRISGTLRVEQSTFMFISRSILLGMTNVSDKSWRKNQNTQFTFSHFFLRKSCRLWDSEGKNV